MKISEKYAKLQVKKQIFASRNAEMHEKFNGKTLIAIAGEMDLDEEQIDIVVIGENYNLLIKQGVKEIFIPVSDGLADVIDSDAGLPIEELLACKFWMSMATNWVLDPKDEKNKRKIKELDKDGREVKSPYLFVDMPSNKHNDETLDPKTKLSIQEKFPPKHRTQDGHYVRSKAEIIIDNFLYNNSLVHAYERKLPVDEDIYCDFYLPQGKLYIEFWGIENDPKYTRRKREKQAIYKKYQLQLIELVENDIYNLDEVLAKKLLNFGIKIL